MTPPSKLVARLGGLLSLTTIAAGVSASVFITDKMVVSGDAAATAHNILAAEPLYRFGYLLHLVDFAFYLAVTAILYVLLEPAGRILALLAAFFSIVGTAVVVATSVFYFAPFVFLQGAVADGLGAAHAQALTALSLRFRGIGSAIALVFFAVHLVFVGWGVMRSTFLPRALGALSMFGGACFLVSILSGFAAPTALGAWRTYLLAPGILGQAALALWLLTVGFNVERWRAQAAAAH